MISGAVAKRERGIPGQRWPLGARRKRPRAAEAKRLGGQLFDVGLLVRSARTGRASVSRTVRAKPSASPVTFERETRPRKRHARLVAQQIHFAERCAPSRPSRTTRCASLAFENALIRRSQPQCGDLSGLSALGQIVVGAPDQFRMSGCHAVRSMPTDIEACTETGRFSAAHGQGLFASEEIEH